MSNQKKKAGYKRMIESEFAYLKDRISERGATVRGVAVNTKRSPETIKRIAKSKTFKEYQAITHADATRKKPSQVGLFEKKEEKKKKEKKEKTEGEQIAGALWAIEGKLGKILERLPDLNAENNAHSSEPQPVAAEVRSTVTGN